MSPTPCTHVLCRKWTVFVPTVSAVSGSRCSAVRATSGCSHGAAPRSAAARHLSAESHSFLLILPTHFRSPSLPSRGLCTACALTAAGWPALNWPHSVLRTVCKYRRDCRRVARRCTADRRIGINWLAALLVRRPPALPEVQYSEYAYPFGRPGAFAVSLSLSL